MRAQLQRSSSEAALQSRQTAEINAISEKIEEVSNELEKALGDPAANEDLNRRIAQEKAPFFGSGRFN